MHRHAPMLANILLPFQVVLELTAGLRHLDYFVRWSDNHDVKQETKQCQVAKDPGRYISEARTDSDSISTCFSQLMHMKG